MGRRQAGRQAVSGRVCCGSACPVSACPGACNRSIRHFCVLIGVVCFPLTHALLCSEYQRDVAEVAARADSLQAALEEARTSARQEAAVAGQLRNRVLLMEEELESARLSAAQAQQAAALAAAGAVVGAAAAAGDAAGVSSESVEQRRRLEAELAERQRAAEDRAAQLEATGR